MIMKMKFRYSILAATWIAAFTLATAPAQAAGSGPANYQSIDAQYIAALGDPKARSGGGAQTWGIWKEDPGPRGVELGQYARLKKNGGVTPARWKFDPADWWLEENGLIMEQPVFPLQPGRYVVTGARGAIAVLTVHPADSSGDRRWELDSGANLHDVTHLGCRAARYRPATGAGSCTPDAVKRAAFPVAAGRTMPAVNGCSKQDYAVLIVIGLMRDR